MTNAVWDGWWVAKWRERLVHIEADDAEDAAQGSVEALRGLGDPGELSAFPYIEYRNHARPGDFTRAVIDRARRHPGAHPRRDVDRRRPAR